MLSVDARPPRRRDHSYQDVAGAVVAALGTALLVLAIALVWLLILRPAPAPEPMRDASGVPVADVTVENVFARLPDGREARGTFTLRLRESAAPADLRLIAAYTPTPVDRFVQAGAKTPVPPAPGTAEYVLRDRVAAAMGTLGYEDVAGEAGRARLREAVRDSVNAALPNAPVTAVYVRDYLVQ